jgi:two-component system sensor histidine kinase PilS (NtrC family)
VDTTKPLPQSGCEIEKSGDPQKRSLQGLLLFRLLLAIFFLVLTLLVQSRRSTDLLAAHLQPLYFFCCTLFTFTVVAALSLKHVKNIRRFAYIQLLFDVEAVTGLIFLSGGIESLFSFLYMPVIISAALLLLRRGSIWVASVCTLSYGTLLDLQYFDVISPLRIVVGSPGVTDSGVYFHSLLMNIAAFYIVAGLSGYLAEGLRESHAQLRKQKEDLDQLEMLHRNIVQSIGSGLLTVDLQGDVVFHNRSVQEILGLESEKIAGRNISEVIPGLHTPTRHSPVQPNNRLERLELTYAHPSGGNICLGYSISTLEEADRNPYGWIIIFQDLTQLKTMEDHMRRMEHLAFAGRIAAEIAHEIKNPLAAMSGAVQLLQNESSAPASLKTRLLEIVHREIGRINELVVDFLWLSKGVQKPGKHDSIPVSGAIREIISLLQTQGRAAVSHSIKAQFDCEPTIEMDSHHFRQILWNLLENALEAMPDGGFLSVRVGWSNMNREVNDEEVRIDIEDSGPGIADEVRVKLFEPFLTTKEKGMGLGLSIVYQLVKGAGGRIEAHRSELGGAMFSIFFPVSPAMPLVKNGVSDYTSTH